MSLLSIVQDVCDVIGVPRVSAVIGSSEPDARQFLQLANREAKEGARRTAWTALMAEKSFVSVAAEAQTVDLTDVAWILNETFFNRSRQHRVSGPLSAEEWQRQKALTTSLGTDQYRLRGASLLLMPAPPAGETYAFEYVTNEIIRNEGESEYRLVFEEDSDVYRVNASMLMLGMVWRWKALKGLDYAEDFRVYETMVANLIARDGTQRTLSAAGERLWPGPHACVPEGSWLV